MDEGALVVLRSRTFLQEGEPVALCDGCYPADMATGTAIEQPPRIRGAVYAIIEDAAGPIRRQIAWSVDDLVARMPTQEEAVELQLPPGVPVEVQDSVVAANRHEFRYEERMR